MFLFFLYGCGDCCSSCWEGFTRHFKVCWGSCCGTKDEESEVAREPVVTSVVPITKVGPGEKKDGDNPLQLGSSINLSPRQASALFQVKTVPPVSAEMQSGMGQTEQEHLQLQDVGDEGAKEKRNILIVDDDALNLKMLSHMLNNAMNYSCHISAASCITKALEYYDEQKGNFKLIISDLNMGKESGATLIRRLRQEKHYEGQIVLWTSDSRSQEQTDEFCTSYELEDVLYLPKAPLSTKDLKEFLQAIGFLPSK